MLGLPHLVISEESSLSSSKRCDHHNHHHNHHDYIHHHRHHHHHHYIIIIIIIIILSLYLQASKEDEAEAAGEADARANNGTRRSILLRDIWNIVSKIHFFVVVAFILSRLSWFGDFFPVAFIRIFIDSFLLRSMTGCHWMWVGLVRVPNLYFGSTIELGNLAIRCLCVVRAPALISFGNKVCYAEPFCRLCMK